MLLQKLDAKYLTTFKHAIPLPAATYGDAIFRLANEANISPCLLCEIGMHESKWGTSDYLDQPGPAGTGDFIPRRWGPRPLPADGRGWGRGLLQIDLGAHRKWLDSHEWWVPEEAIKYSLSILNANRKFFLAGPRASGIAVKGKHALRRKVAPGIYPDPRPLVGAQLVHAVVAAYNTGCGNVIKSLACGRSPDLTSAHRKYGRSIIGKARSLERLVLT